MSRIVVVGGGIGGLAAAALLGHAGHRVTLLEASPQLGGKSRRIELDSQRIDTGPAIVTFPGVWDEYLRRWDGLAGTDGEASSVAGLELKRLPEVGTYYFRDEPCRRSRQAGAGDHTPPDDGLVQGRAPSGVVAAPPPLRDEADHQELPG
jgi:hypothetical protein